MVVSNERRLFTREFKLAALERLEVAPDVSALAEALGVRRELLYKWRAKFIRGGASALRSSGRPRPVPPIEPDPGDEGRVQRHALAERRVAELERKIGQQALELEFFRAALRRVRVSLPANGGPGETGSTQ